jgi:hypothetical protein
MVRLDLKFHTAAGQPIQARLAREMAIRSDFCVDANLPLLEQARSAKPARHATPRRDASIGTAS